MTDARQWIEALRLIPHPEGGYFRQTYQCSDSIDKKNLPERFDGKRRIAAAIYFLLQGDDFSALHRLRQDELWHFYQGCSLTIHVIDESGVYFRIRLGVDLHNGERPQAVAKAGWLFGATVDNPRAYALVGCTTAPGFEYADFEMPCREHLINSYPQHRKIIKRLTR